MALEAQRDLLGSAVVDTALTPLREARAALIARRTAEQRRLVTVLFADVVDFTVLSRALDPEDTRTTINAYFRRWHEQIAAHGGVVEKFIGDAVMAVFGLHQSHEDDPHRAIRAALAMRAALAELNAEFAEGHPTLVMRVGIDTGEVVVSSLDDRPGQDVVVVGDTVNRAARIQAAAAPGGILISRDTHRHVRGGFSFTEVEPLQLKGIPEPVRAYLVGSERPAGYRLDAARGVEGVTTRTIGREIFLSRLENQFQDVIEERRWRVVTVVGDAGVGKSRVLLELDRWLAEIDQPLYWFRGTRGADSTERRQRPAPRRGRSQARHPRTGRARDGPPQARGRDRRCARDGRGRPPQGPPGRVLAGIRPERQRLCDRAPARSAGPAQAGLGPPGRVLRPARRGAPRGGPPRGPALGRRGLSGVDRRGRRGAPQQPGARGRDRPTVAAGASSALG